MILQNLDRDLRGIAGHLRVKLRSQEGGALLTLERLHLQVEMLPVAIQA